MIDSKEVILQKYLDSKWVKLDDLDKRISEKLTDCLTSFRPDKDIDNRFEKFYGRFFNIIRWIDWVFGYVSEIAHIWQWELIPMDIEVFWPWKLLKVPYEKVYGWITDFDVDNVWNCVFIFSNKLYYNFEKVTCLQLNIEQSDIQSYCLWKKTWIIYYFVSLETDEEWWNGWYLFSLNNWKFTKLSDFITTREELKAKFDEF